MSGQAHSDSECLAVIECTLDAIRRLAHITLRVLAAALAAALISLAITGGHWHWLGLAPSAVGAAFVGVMAVLVRRRRAILCQAIDGLTEATSLHALIRLFVSASSYQDDIADHTRRKLAELLPQATEAHLVLPAGDVSVLLGQLTESTARGEVPRQIALLNYLAGTDYVDALPTASKLADGSGNSAIRDAAQRCRDRLLHVQADAERSGALLRPADPPGGETLLRPAEPVPEEQLLRSVDGAPE